MVFTRSWRKACTPHNARFIDICRAEARFHLPLRRGNTLSAVNFSQFKNFQQNFPLHQHKLLNVPVLRFSSHCPQSHEKEGAKPFDEIPVIHLSGFRNLLKAIKVSKKLHEVTKDIIKEYGPIFRFDLVENTVFVSDMVDIETVFKNEGPFPCRGISDAIIESRKDNELGLGILASQGEESRQIRALTNRVVLNPSKTAIISPIINQVTDDFIAKIKESRRLSFWQKGEKEGILQINEEIRKWSLECICSVIFEKRFGFLEPTMNPETKEIFKLLYSHLSYIRVVEGRPASELRTKLRYFFGKYKDSQKRIFSLAEEAVDKKIVELRTSRDADEDNSLLGMMVKLAETEKYNLSKKEVIATVHDTFLAAIGTTTNTTLFLLHEVSKWHDLQERLFTEINKAAPTENNCDTQIIEQCPLLRSCLKETLRFYPVAQAISRITPTDLELSGYHIPAKTKVLGLVIPSSRNPKYFQRPEEFLPERWLKYQTGEWEKPPQYSYLPFSAGGRMCTGKRIAELEIHTLLFKLMKTFQLKNLAPENLKLVTRLILIPGSPIKINFIDRQ